MSCLLYTSTDFPADSYPRPWFDVQREADGYTAFCGGKVADCDAQDLAQFVLGNQEKMYVHWNSGHVVCSYDRLVTLGLPALLHDAELSAQRQTDPTHRDAAFAMLITCLLYTSRCV